MLVHKRINAAMSLRGQAAPRTAISGPKFFGFSAPSVREVVEALDPDHLCIEYWEGQQQRQQRWHEQQQRQRRRQQQRRHERGKRRRQSAEENTEEDDEDLDEWAAEAAPVDWQPLLPRTPPQQPARVPPAPQATTRRQRGPARQDAPAGSHEQYARQHQEQQQQQQQQQQAQERAELPLQQPHPQAQELADQEQQAQERAEPPPP
ncbi:Transforming growth factor beta regulator 1 [Micractinium conductrix]|uniref:Transforming growth factor beta regulator 1 n=1 Tax=Micractinium conductrix TaxID=554055 RepID=A0A2P6VA43_9CHLO|nr:Transforming growth factor beta regulator 1 [Micractinium conductrix]|eukprot:PSC70964.1 Transforming growth factor beta regulator 1 [Micractinium conductrix]